MLLMRPFNHCQVGVLRKSPSFRIVTWIAGLCWSCSQADGGVADESGALMSNGQADGGGAVQEPDPTLPVVGTFAVTLVAETASAGAFTSVLGRVYDAPMPDSLVWEVADMSNGCELRIPSVPFCDPACGTRAVCAQGDQCVPYPEAQEVGVISVTGLGDSEFEMEPIVGAYQPPADVDLPYPPSDEGTEIRLSTSGGAYAPFVVRSRGILPLEIQAPETIPLVSNESLSLQWTPPGDAALSRIHVRMDISHHGGLKGEIDCDVEDNGGGEIAASLFDQLVALGVAGFPTINLTRIANGTTAIEPGRVLLTVSSRVERALAIPGVTSCNTVDECGGGQMCASDRTCQDVSN